MDQKKLSKEEKILRICEIVKGQSVTDTVHDKQLMSGLNLAYDLGNADRAVESA